MSPKRTSPDLADWRRNLARVIGERIGRVRRERGMTQANVAGNRFSKAYISAVERGQAFPSMPSLDFIAEQLGVPPAWILTDPDPGELGALPALIRRAWVSEGRVFVELSDGRAVGMPLAQSRKLSSATVAQLDGWTVTDAGRAIRWPELGEEIGLEDFLGVRLLEPSEVARATHPRKGAATGGDAPRRGRRRAGEGTYAPLGAWLDRQRADEIRPKFDELERVLGRALPASARRYSAPWSSQANSIARAIRERGWRASFRPGSDHVVLRRSSD